MHKVRHICQVWATCIKLGHMSGLGNVHKVRSYGSCLGNVHKVRPYGRSGQRCIKLGHMAPNVHKVRSDGRSGQRA